MAKKTQAEKTTDALRKRALRYPEVEEAGVCVNAAFKARKKSFVFMGIKPGSYHVRLKLADGLAEASALAEEHPGSYDVGKMGWIKATFATDEAPPKGLLERWIDESYRLLVHKKLVAQLPERGPPR